MNIKAGIDYTKMLPLHLNRALLALHVSQKCDGHQMKQCPRRSRLSHVDSTTR